MSRYYICEIEQKVTNGKELQFDKAIKQVQNYIKENIDPTFPVKEFQDWLDSDESRAFRWNHNSYNWQKVR